ncbi:hypothetical protein [Christiangramia aquimixticola]|uniref:hypothetical protein n=1 Tax=Christiangramia aquimixticola TaxID=1697558 RepID=UPI003AA8B0A4
MTIEFKEEQQFTQWWLWLLLLPVGLIPVWAIYNQVFREGASGNSPLSNIGLILLSIFVFSLIAIFRFIKLKTEIDQNEIRINFFPIIKKSVSWEEVKKAEVVDYGFVGGWGIRLWTAYGTVYNIKGSKGLAIELISGKKILIGTQKEAELKRIVAAARSHY